MLGAREALVDARLAAGAHHGLVGELQRLVREHPLREGLWERLMIALSRAGRQAEVLEAYQRLRRLLADELGAPGPGIAAVQHRIFTADTSVAVRPATRELITAAGTGGVAEPPSRPAQLPSDLADFSGRAAEIAVLCDALLTRQTPGAVPLVAISRAGGVGRPPWRCGSCTRSRTTSRTASCT